MGQGLPGVATLPSPAVTGESEAALRELRSMALHTVRTYPAVVPLTCISKSRSLNSRLMPSTQVVSE